MDRALVLRIPEPRSFTESLTLVGHGAICIGVGLRDTAYFIGQGFDRNAHASPYKTLLFLLVAHEFPGLVLYPFRLLIALRHPSDIRFPNMKWRGFSLFDDDEDGTSGTLALMAPRQRKPLTETEVEAGMEEKHDEDEEEPIESYIRLTAKVLGAWVVLAEVFLS